MQAVLDALVEPRRREILRLVRDQEMLAGAIAARFPEVSRPTVSQHLRVLREAGLLHERREGTKRLYRTRAEGLSDVRGFLDEFWDARLQTLKVEAEASRGGEMAGDTGEPVVKEIYIDARPEVVFEFFVDAEKLTRWLAVEATLDPRPGGACLQVHAGDDRRECGPCHMHGEFLDIDPPNRVVFSWGFVEAEIGVPPGSSTVEVTLQPVGSGTRVRLVRRGLPSAEVEDHSRGWAEMLDRLARTITATTARTSTGT